MGGLPPYQVLMIALAAFCLVSIIVAAGYTIALRQVQYVKATTVVGQLQYAGPYLAYDFIWDAKQKVKSIEKMNIGLILVNQSLKTIKYRVEYFHARVEGLSPDTSKFIGRTIEIASGTGQSSHPNAIDFGKKIRTELKGTMEFKLAYGDKEDFPYHIEKKFEFELFLKKEASKHPIGIVSPAFREI